LQSEADEHFPPSRLDAGVAHAPSLPQSPDAHMLSEPQSSPTTASFVPASLVVVVVVELLLQASNIEVRLKALNKSRYSIVMKAP
jgi:hypothetical protein